MKRKTMALLTILAVFLMGTLTGCGFVADGPFGWAYTNSKSPITIGTAKSGSKTGQACVRSYFGMFTVGDGSIETAMKTAGIKEVYTVTHDNFSILGTYTSQCTVVSGE
jgi:hypothetical protein